jgi:hypothetical protein
MTEKTKNESLAGRELFFLISAILGFLVDLVAFLGFFGAGAILIPVESATPRSLLPHLSVPAGLETVTFFIVIYTFIAMIFLYRWVFQRILDRKFDDRQYYLLGFIYILAPTLPVIWFWVFEHLALWLYVFLIPTFVSVGLTKWVIPALEETDINQAIVWIVCLFFLAPVTVWFESGYGWSVLGSFGITCVSAGIGAGIGAAASHILTNELSSRYYRSHYQSSVAPTEVDWDPMKLILDSTYCARCGGTGYVSSRTSILDREICPDCLGSGRKSSS